MWSLWMARNKRRHGEPGIPLRRAVEWAKDTAYDLWQLSHLIKDKGMSKAVEHWRRPQPGWIKCNVDASFFAEEGRGALGAVHRDHEGRPCGGAGMTTV
jgi:hypothetical protein